MKKVMGIAFYVFLAVEFFLTLLWPGDAPFINDEPKLFLAAYNANQHHRLAATGLEGSVALPYGPLPTWLYQGLLLCTRNPELWVVYRAACMFVLMTIGLLLLSRGLGLWKWFVPIVLASPYIWFYSRLLWDNTFLLPFSALSIGAYARFLSCKSDRMLFVSCTTALLLPSIHITGLPLSLVLLCHMALFCRSRLKRLWIPVGLVGLVLFITHVPYLSSFLRGLKNYETHVLDETTSIWAGWVFPLGGGRLMSALRLDYFFEKGWLPGSPLFLALKWVTCFGYAAVLLGAGMAIGSAWKKFRGGSFTRWLRVDSPMSDPRLHIGIIGIASLALYVPACGLSHSSGDPHYYNGLWIVYVVFAWLVIDRIAKKAAGLACVSLYGISVATVLVIIIGLVHTRGGNRGFYYGPTIENQLAIARACGPGERNDIRTNIPNFIYTPSLQALRTICLTDDHGSLQGPLILCYANDNPLSGRVAAVQDKGKK